MQEIDFETVMKRVEQGESVFITSKRNEKLKTSLVAKDDATEPWYFTHI